MKAGTSAAMRKARDGAQQTPPVVREAMLAGPLEVNGVTFQPLTLATLWLLEKIEHPLVANNPENAEGKLSLTDTISALFIFSAPQRARALLAAASREEFDAAAQELAEKFQPSDFPRLGEVLRQIFTEGLATAPQAGKTANPR